MTRLMTPRRVLLFLTALTVTILAGLTLLRPSVPEPTPVQADPLWAAATQILVHEKEGEAASERGGFSPDWEAVEELLATPKPTPRPKPKRVLADFSKVGAPSGSMPDLIRQLWPGPNKEEAVRVAKCESNFNPRTVGRAGERELLQIHPGHFDGRWGGTPIRAAGFKWEEMFDPIRNLQAGWWLYQRNGGWGPWTCRP